MMRQPTGGVSFRIDGPYQRELRLQGLPLRLTVTMGYILSHADF